MKGCISGNWRGLRYLLLATFCAGTSKSEMKNGHRQLDRRCPKSAKQRPRPTIGMGDFFLRDPAAVRLAPHFVNVRSCTAEVGEPPHVQGRFVVGLIDHSNLISHFSIGGWIASFCAF